MAATLARHPFGAVPRPTHWSGFRIVAEEFEFWEQRAFRLHVRRRCTRSATGDWSEVRVFP